MVLRMDTEQTYEVTNEAGQKTRVDSGYALANFLTGAAWATGQQLVPAAENAQEAVTDAYQHGESSLNIGEDYWTVTKVD